MEVIFDIDQAFNHFMASADFQTIHRASGVHYVADSAKLKKALTKTFEPVQDMLEDVQTARSVLKEHGYGNEGMPLHLMVEDLLARLVDAAGPTANPTPSDDTTAVLNPDAAFDAILGRQEPEILGFKDVVDAPNPRGQLYGQIEQLAEEKAAESEALVEQAREFRDKVDEQSGTADDE